MALVIINEMMFIVQWLSCSSVQLWLYMLFDNRFYILDFLFCKIYLLVLNFNRGDIVIDHI